MRHRDGAQQFAPRQGARLGHRQRTGQHVGRDVARGQDGVHVEGVDQLGIGECGAEDAEPVAGADDRGGPRGAGQASVVDADAALGRVDGGQRRADGVEQQPARFLHDRGRQVLEAGLGEMRELFDECHGAVRRWSIRMRGARGGQPVYIASLPPSTGSVTPLT